MRRSSIRLPILVVLGAAVALTLLAVSITAQAQSTTGAVKTTDYAELGKAPDKAIQRGNPMQSDSQAVAAGAKLYDLHCAECHGENAEGARKGPSLRAAQVQQATPGALFWVLSNGVVRKGMPVWSKLPEPQRWQLVSYIKSLSPAAK